MITKQNVIKKIKNVKGQELCAKLEERFPKSTFLGPYTGRIVVTIDHDVDGYVEFSRKDIELSKEYGYSIVSIEVCKYSTRVELSQSTTDKMIHCSNCAEEFDSNDSRIKILTDPNGGGLYPICGSCIESTNNEEVIA